MTRLDHPFGQLFNQLAPSPPLTPIVVNLRRLVARADGGTHPPAPEVRDTSKETVSFEGENSSKRL